MKKRVAVIAVSALLTLPACGTDTDDPAAGPTTLTSTSSSSPPASTESSTTAVDGFSGEELAYGSISEAQRLDLYTPQAGEAPYPLLVLIDGGGWTTGDKRGELPSAVIPGLLGMGYSVASVNYRLAWEAVFPAQLLDVKAAIRYLRANAADLGLDPDRFVALGESAGAHLALLLGTTEGIAEFDDPDLGNIGASSRVQAVVDFYGPAALTTMDAQRALAQACASGPDPNIALLLGASPVEAPELAAAASPVTYLHPGQNLPPFFIAHGDADCVVPYQQSVDLHDAIEAVAPGRSQLAIVPGSGHYLEFDFGSQNEALAAFLDEALDAG